MSRRASDALSEILGAIPLENFMLINVPNLILIFWAAKKPLKIYIRFQGPE